MNGLNLSPLMMRAAGLDYLAERLPLYADTAEERALVSLVDGRLGVLADLEEDVEMARGEAEDAESERYEAARQADDAFDALRQVRDMLADAGDALPEVAEKVRAMVVEFLRSERES